MKQAYNSRILYQQEEIYQKDTRFLRVVDDPEVLKVTVVLLLM